MHVIKIGDFYLSWRGTWTPKQSDALRIVSDRERYIAQQEPRLVKLTRRAAPSTDTTPR